MTRTTQLLFLICLAICSCHTQHKKSLVIRYSTEDCAVCNIPYYEISALQTGVEKTIVFRSSANLKEIEYPIKLAQSNGFKIVFSDSFYYAVDSLVQSKVYLFEGNKLILNETLKSVNMQTLKKLIGIDTVAAISGTQKSTRFVMEKNASRTSQTAVDMNRTIEVGREFIYVLNKTDGDLIRIKKTNLNAVWDTIHLSAGAGLEAIYKSHFADNYRRVIDDYINYTQTNKLPYLKPVFFGSFVKGDTVYVQAWFRYLVKATDSVKGPGVIFDQSCALLTIVNGRFISSEPLSRVPVKTAQSEYYLTSGSFFVHRNKMVFPISRPSFTERDLLFAYTGKHDGIITGEELLPIPLPKLNVESGLGYRLMPSIIKKGDLLTILYDDGIYDLKTFKKYFFPFHLAKNYKRSVSGKSPDLQFKATVMDYCQIGNELRLVYASDDSLHYCVCAFEGAKLILKQDKLLSTKVSASDYCEVKTEVNGLYMFLKSTNCLSFRSYSML